MLIQLWFYLQEMVELMQVQSCDGKVLADKILKVIEFVQSKGGIIVAVITDNAKPNQSAYAHLTNPENGGVHMESFLNPSKPGEKNLHAT
jgi:hypothetical protein